VEGYLIANVSLDFYHKTQFYFYVLLTLRYGCIITYF